MVLSALYPLSHSACLLMNDNLLSDDVSKFYAFLLLTLIPQKNQSKKIYKKEYF